MIGGQDRIWEWHGMMLATPQYVATLWGEPGPVHLAM